MRMTYTVSFLLAASLLCGCGALVVVKDQPQGAPPSFAPTTTELGDKRGDYGRLTFAYLPADVNKTGDIVAPGTHHPGLYYWRSAFESGTGKYFRRVIKVESVEDAKALGADLVAVVEVVSKVTPWTNHGGFDIQAVVATTSGEKIDTIFGRTDVEHQSMFAVNSWPKADAEAQEAFDHAFLFSRRVVAWADSYQPGANAAPAAERVKPEPTSDVDQPSYSSPERARDYALVIGIEKYKTLPSATFAKRDAAAVGRHLEALGIPKRNIITLKDADATRASLQSYLEEWLPRNSGPDSTVFVYYSGHGAPDVKTGQAFLVPWDGDPKFLKSSAYSTKQLFSSLEKLKAKRIVVALDSCFSGAGGRSVLPEGARPLVTKVDEGFAPSGRMVILAAASGDEITSALDEQGHGIFTYFFLKGLSQGKRSARELFDYIKPKVEEEARRQNRDQNPLMAGEDAPL